MTAMSFTAKLTKQGDGTAIFLVRALARGKSAWYYLKVASIKLPLFNRAMESAEGCNLESFGEILESGWGKQPPANIAIHMKAEFNA